MYCDFDRIDTEVEESRAYGPAGANETLVFTLTLIVREDDMKDE